MWDSNTTATNKQQPNNQNWSWGFDNFSVNQTNNSNNNQNNTVQGMNQQ